MDILIHLHVAKKKNINTASEIIKRGETGSERMAQRYLYV